MTSIDERIKRELESDPSLITGAEPVSDMVLDAFKGRIGRYMVFAVFTVLFFELWSWMQINRVALKRDIKELELTIKMLGFRKDS